MTAHYSSVNLNPNKFLENRKQYEYFGHNKLIYENLHTRSYCCVCNGCEDVLVCLRVTVQLTDHIRWRILSTRTFFMSVDDFHSSGYSSVWEVLHKYVFLYCQSGRNIVISSRFNFTCCQNILIVCYCCESIVQCLTRYMWTICRCDFIWFYCYGNIS
jgi:hypothetical protein